MSKKAKKSSKKKSVKKVSKKSSPKSTGLELVGIKEVSDVNQQKVNRISHILKGKLNPRHFVQVVNEIQSIISE